MRLSVIGPSIAFVLLTTLPVACKSSGHSATGTEPSGNEDAAQGATQPQPPSSRTVEVGIGEPVPIVQSQMVRQFPWVAVSGSDVFVSYAQALDGFPTSSAPVVGGLNISRDQGATFPEYVPQTLSPLQLRP